MQRIRYLASASTLVSALAVTLVAFRTDQGFYSDPALQTIIRASFPQASGWQRMSIPGTQHDRWTATVVAAPDARIRCAAC